MKDDYEGFAKAKPFYADSWKINQRMLEAFQGAATPAKDASAKPAKLEN